MNKKGTIFVHWSVEVHTVLNCILGHILMQCKIYHSNHIRRVMLDSGPAREIRKRRLSFFLRMENILKTGLCENWYITMIMRFFRQSFWQTEIQNGCWLLRFRISPALYGRSVIHLYKSVAAFGWSKLRFYRPCWQHIAATLREKNKSKNKLHTLKL